MIDSSDALTILGRAIAGVPVPGSELVFDGGVFQLGVRGGRLFRTSDDFAGGNTTSGTVGEMGWKFAAGAGTPSVSEATGETNSVGVISISTGSTSGNDVYLYLGTGSPPLLVAQIDSPVKVVDLVFKCKLPATFASADFRFGWELTSAVGAAPANGLFLEKLAADTNWFVKSAFIGSSRVDTGIAASNTDAICARLRIVPHGTAANARAYAWVATTIAGLNSAARMDFTDWQAVSAFGSGLPFVSVVTQTGAARSINVDLVDILVRMDR